MGKSVMQMEASLPGPSSICSDGPDEAQTLRRSLLVLKDHRLPGGGGESSASWTKGPAECEE